MSTSTITFDLDTVPADDRDRVAALIPDPRVAGTYVHRFIDGLEDFEWFDVAVEERENVLLVGPTGSSKTTVFRAYAAAHGLPYYRLDCNAAMDPGVIVGRTGFLPDGTAGWIDGDMTLVARYGGVIVIEESNMAHPRITAAWHQLTDVARRLSIPEAGETIQLGRGGIGEPQPTLVGTTFNDRYQGTVRLNEAFANRFAMPFDWDYERAVEEQLMTSTTLLDVADSVRSMAEIRSPLSTNMLMEFERHAARLGMVRAATLFVNHFAKDERGPVGRALDANSAIIARELGLNAPPVVTAEDIGPVDEDEDDD